MSSQIPDISSLPLARRIVTGHDENAKSKFLYDDAGGEITEIGTSRFQTIWFTDDVPADCSSATGNDPTGNKTFRVCNDGSVCTVVWMRPGSSSPLHRTKSIDYGVVLEGEVELELDNGDKSLMKTGDIVIQRETMHAWHNRHTTTWAKMLFVLVVSKGTEGAHTEGSS